MLCNVFFLTSKLLRAKEIKIDLRGNSIIYLTLKLINFFIKNYKTYRIKTFRLPCDRDPQKMTICTTFFSLQKESLRLRTDCGDPDASGR